MNVAALMPVKGFRNAKQRLNPLLNSVAREHLAETMFRDVLRQVRLARGLAATFVVTGDDSVAAIAATAGAEVIREKSENGETSRRRLCAQGIEERRLRGGLDPARRHAAGARERRRVGFSAGSRKTPGRHSLCSCRRTIVSAPMRCFWRRRT